MNQKGTLTLQRDSFDPSRTLLILNGQAVASIPWQACNEIADSFRRAARAGEEYEKANIIIAQDAALVRTGAPFALSNNPKIREAAYSDAQWDSAARKAMPLRGAPSPRAVGTPSLIKHRNGEH